LKVEVDVIWKIVGIELIGAGLCNEVAVATIVDLGVTFPQEVNKTPMKSIMISLYNFSMLASANIKTFTIHCNPNK
jgi:hypothetical protein